MLFILYRSLRNGRQGWHQLTLSAMSWMTKIFLAGLLPLSVHAFGQPGITISEKNAPLEKIFHLIEHQTGYSIWYEKAVLDKTTPTDIDVKNAGLEETLNDCCLHQPIVYSLVGKMIVIRARENQPPASPVWIVLHGKVLNEKGEALGGVTISVKGSNRIVAADDKGLFVLDNISGTETILVSHVGYFAQEVSIDKRTSIIIQLMLNDSKLDEVEVIGYGTTTKRMSTGSNVSISASTIEEQNITNPLEAISGRAAGVQVIQTSGLPGAAITVQIRGRNSIAAGNSPLYIVDGVPFTASDVESVGGQDGGGSPLNLISPADIESIDILKDADATAIYGSRAANGVVLITTKKGKPGKMQVTLNLKNGFSKATHLPATLNTKEYLQVRRDAFANSGITPTNSNAYDLLSWDTTADFNWQQWYLGNTASLQEGTIGLSGGTQQTSYLLSGSTNHQTTILPNNSLYNRSNVHMAITHNSADKKLLLATSAFYTTDHNRYGGPITPVILNVARTIPNLPPYDAAGNLMWPNGKTNPFSTMKSYTKNQTENLNGNLTVQYSFKPGFFLKSTFGYNSISNDQILAYPASSQNPSYQPQGFSTFGTQRMQTVIAEPQAGYRFKFAGGTNDLFAGVTWQDNHNLGQSINAYNYSNDLLIENLAYGTPGYIRSTSVDYRYLSYFGRLTWNRQNKYIVNGSFRRDGSTRFGPGKQFGNFGSIGAAWIFSSERLFQQQTLLSFGKLKGSYGTTGNDAIGDYGYLATYAADAPYGNAQTLSPSRIANPDFRWELNKKLELSLELGFLKDRILFSMAWYRNRTGNQLVGYALPSITGFNSYQANLPALVQNRGWEFELNTSPLKLKNLTWTVSANLSIPQNKLLAYPDIENSPYANNYVVGKSLNIIQAYHFLGVDPQTGLAKIDDVNKDGVFTQTSSYNNQQGDYIIAGKTDPVFFCGLSNTIRYKKMQLDFFIQYVNQKGMNLYGYSYSVFGRTINGWKDYLPYWKKPGDVTELPKPFASSNVSSQMFATSDAGISDASFFRLKSVSFSYGLPDSWLHKLHATQLTVFFTGQNLFTLSKFKGYDPEMSGIGVLAIPALKSFAFGLKCSF